MSATAIGPAQPGRRRAAIQAPQPASKEATSPNWLSRACITPANRAPDALAEVVGAAPGCGAVPMKSRIVTNQIRRCRLVAAPQLTVGSAAARSMTKP